MQNIKYSLEKDYSKEYNKGNGNYSKTAIWRVDDTVIQGEICVHPFWISWSSDVGTSFVVPIYFIKD